jgi:hypothetical protein
MIAFGGKSYNLHHDGLRAFRAVRRDALQSEILGRELIRRRGKSGG